MTNVTSVLPETGWTGSPGVRSDPGRGLRPALAEALGTPAPTGRSDPGALQQSFDELGEPLRETTFVVVDLETTGGSALTEAITEIGAVKVRGGEVLGEFATLVDPGRSIPPQITLLTGISDYMVADAPRIATVLPAFLEFIRGTVLVAHNAGFDIGFLKAACARQGLPWPAPAVVDTVRLARRVLSPEEAPSVRLGALALLVGSRVTPDHRALHDARATVDVLHAMFERLGNLGVHSLAELQDAARDVSPGRRRKRRMADHLPAAPGVYLFRGRRGEVLYVGTSRNLRQRVRSYFSASELRPRIKQMVLLAEQVDHVQCAHSLEALVREQRLIAVHQPRYNRRSRSPGKVHWVVLTDEAFPRLSVVSVPSAAAAMCLGPFRCRADAAVAVEAMQDAVAVRRCSQRIRRRDPDGTPCALAEIGRCGAPCAGAESIESYAGHVRQLVDLVDGQSDEPLRRLRAKVESLGRDGRFAAAAAARDRLAVLVEALDRRQRLGALGQLAELVAARPDGAGGWELAVVRYGRLASAGRVRRGVDPMPVVDGLVAAAETVRPGPGPLPGASAEETSTVLTWLVSGGTRLVRTSDAWSCPVAGAGRWAGFAAAAAVARHQLRDNDLRERSPFR